MVHQANVNVRPPEGILALNVTIVFIHKERAKMALSVKLQKDYSARLESA